MEMKYRENNHFTSTSGGDQVRRPTGARFLIFHSRGPLAESHQASKPYYLDGGSAFSAVSRRYQAVESETRIRHGDCTENGQLTQAWLYCLVRHRW